tara:strand:+ start:26893 stop:27339 length:447 start_codon:yes stop_codon:yes gene_type:complete
METLNFIRDYCINNNLELIELHEIAKTTPDNFFSTFYNIKTTNNDKIIGFYDSTQVLDDEVQKILLFTMKIINGKYNLYYKNINYSFNEPNNNVFEELFNKNSPNMNCPNCKNILDHNTKFIINEKSSYIKSCVKCPNYQYFADFINQ